MALWALAAASAVAWGFKLAAPGSAASGPTAGARTAIAPDPAAIARFLGATQQSAGAPPVATLASRLNLVGVAARSSRSGVALISVDGKPAKPFRVGSTIDEGLVLQSVEARRAHVGTAMQGPVAATLELPPLRR